MKDPRSCNV